MPISQHDYGVPDENELAQLVGAATPHFAFQIRSRVEAYARALPEGHARQPELRRHLERLRELGLGGESAGVARADLPPAASLTLAPAPGPEAPSS